MQEYYSLEKGDEEAVSDPVYLAHLMDKLPYPRAALRAFLIAKAPLAPFLVATEMREDTILSYQKLFFDTAVFPNRLIKIAYVRQLPVNTEHAKFERDMLMCGLQLGWEYVMWKVTGGKFHMPVKDALQHIMSDSLWRSREHVFNAITDARAKESKGWISSALKTADLLERTSPDKQNALEELRLSLVGMDTTLTKDKVNGEILS